LQINPKANIQDLLLIVATLIILGNIASIVFLKVGLSRKRVLRIVLPSC
jgi:hypothetical protein